MHRVKVLAASLGCICASPTALAQLATWNGGSGAWTDPNWIVNGILTTIPNGSGVTANIPVGAVGLDPGMSFSVGGVTLTGSGFLTGQGQLTVSGGLIQNAGTLGADVFLTGQGSTWTGGSWGSRANRSTTVGSTGALQILVSGDADLARRTITNNGAVTHLNGRVTGNQANGAIAATAIVNNGSWIESTVFALEFLNPGGQGLWTFTNNNTFTKQGSGLTVFTDVKFDSAGLVDVRNGTVNFNGWGTSGPNAVFHAEPGTAINFGGNTIYTANGSDFTGNGQFTAANTFIMTGTIQASNLTFDGATIGGTHTLSGPNFRWTGANIGQRAQNAGTILTPGSSLEIDVTGDVSLIRRSLTNNGAVTHLNGRVVGNQANPGSAIDAASIFNNGAWTESTASALEFTAGIQGFWVFTNNSTFTKQGPGSTVFTRVKFVSAGNVDVQEGTVDFNGGGTSGPTALFNAEPGTALNFGGNSIYTVNGSVFTGDGPFTATNTLIMQGTIAASNLTFDGATIGGTHTLSVPSLLWTGANIGARAETVSTTLTPATSLEIDVAGSVNLARRALTNNGAVTHRSGSIGGAGGAFLTSVINNGTWTESAGVPLEFIAVDPTHTWTYTNNGTFTKQGPQSTTFTRVLFNNTGAIDVQGGTLNMARSFTQTAGEMVLSGGDVAGVLTFTGGSLRGSGDLAGSVRMTGATLDPGLSAGLLNFGANLTLNGATVPIEFEGTSRGTTYDAIDVAGSLSLGGSALQLDVTLLDPATPIGTEFLIFNKASAPAIGGTFAGLSQGTLFNSGIFEFEITYLGGDGNDIVLTVTDSSFCPCACDFDTSSGPGVCDIVDFVTFAGLFTQGDPCACDLDTSSGPGVCDIVDFVTFAGQFATGCP